MKVKDIAKIIEDRAPLDTAESYDNSGLNVGNFEAEVGGILICVDVTERQIAEAVTKKCNMIISHHPLLFNPLKSILTEQHVGKVVAAAVKKDVNLYSAHTNLDCMEGGMSYPLARALGGNNIKPLTNNGFGVIFDIKPKTLGELAKEISSLLNDDHIRTVGKISDPVKRVAYCSGAGGRDGGLIELSKILGADVYISGEFRYDLAVAASTDDFHLIDVCHYSTEKCFLNIVYDILKPAFGGNIYKSETEINPYKE